MHQSLAAQVLTFLYSMILGIALGATYDVFRILRMIINSRNISIFIQDVLYFILSGLMTFLFVLKMNSGDSRFYILAGEGIGWILYHISLGEIIYRCSNKIVSTVKSQLEKLKRKLQRKTSKNHK